MSQQDQNFDRIENYLFDKMGSDDKVAFEKELSEKPTLSEELNQHKLEHHAMKLMLKKDMKARLNELKKNKAQTLDTPAKVVPMRRRLFVYAAAASVVGLLGFFFMKFLSPSDSSAMADNLFGKSSLTVRGENLSDASIKAAYDKMKVGNYKAALVDLESVTESETVLFLKGEAYYYENDYQNALSAFQKILNTPSSKANKDKAEWLKLVTYLKSNGEDSKDFQELLQTISNDKSHAFNKEASNLN